MSPTTSHDLRCPQCSAHVSPTADWCTLCYADLRPPEPVPSVLVETLAEPGPIGSAPVASHGKHARHATTYDDATAEAAESELTATTPRDEETQAAIEARADEMLAVLASETKQHRMPYADRLETTHSRIAVGLVGLVGVVIVIVVLMSLLGVLL